MSHSGGYHTAATNNKVWELQGCRCIVCDKQIEECHHIYPSAKFPKLRYNLGNIVGVCKPHHKLLESQTPENQLRVIAKVLFEAALESWIQ